MRAKLTRLNVVLRTLSRKKEDISVYLTEIKGIIRELGRKYKKRINRTKKSKIINSWKGFTLLAGEINKLSKALLGKGLKKPKKSQNKK
jgi:hypothetical protein